MRTCLVNSINLGDWYQVGRENAIKYMPMGLASLAATMEDNGLTASIIDFNYDIHDGNLLIDDRFFVNAANLILEDSPGIVGFTTMCNSFHLTLAIAKEIKLRSPQTPIILGGPQASIVDEKTLAVFPFVDMILRGEAENTLPYLIETIIESGSLADIPGLTYRSNGCIERNPNPPIIENLDELPIPAYHLFPFEISAVATIDAGRGCPFSCNFCSTSKFWRRRSRLKSVNRIIEEAALLYKEYRVKHFSLLHDMLTVNRDWIYDLCSKIKTIGEDVSWSCSARPDCVNTEMLKTMADSGCDGIFYGVETGSPRMQKKSGKMLDLSKVIPNIRSGLDLGISPIVSFITGFPKERENDVRLTLDMMSELTSDDRVRLQLHLLAPVKETRYYDDFRDTMRFDGCFSDFVGPGLNTNDTEWIEEYPDLFSTFYYFENDELPRSRIMDLDKFANTLCSVLRKPLRAFADQDIGIWDIYLKWQEWIKTPDATVDRNAPFDVFIMGLYDCLCNLADTGEFIFDREQARDEILKFFFNHYHRVQVLRKEFPAVNKDDANEPKGVKLSHSQV